MRMTVRGWWCTNLSKRFTEKISLRRLMDKTRTGLLTATSSQIRFSLQKFFFKQALVVAAHKYLFSLPIHKSGADRLTSITTERKPHQPCNAGCCNTYRLVDSVQTKKNYRCPSLNPPVASSERHPLRQNCPRPADQLLLYNRNTTPTLFSWNWVLTFAPPPVFSAVLILL